MPEKPSSAEEYSSEQTELVRATCLYTATKLGDFMKKKWGRILISAYMLI